MATVTCLICRAPIVTPAGVAWSSETRRNRHLACVMQLQEEATKALKQALVERDLEHNRVVALSVEVYDLKAALDRSARNVVEARRRYAPSRTAGQMPPELGGPAPKPAPSQAAPVAPKPAPVAPKPPPVLLTPEQELERRNVPRPIDMD